LPRGKALYVGAVFYLRAGTFLKIVSEDTGKTKSPRFETPALEMYDRKHFGEHVKEGYKPSMKYSFYS